MRSTHDLLGAERSGASGWGSGAKRSGVRSLWRGLLKKEFRVLGTVTVQGHCEKDCETVRRDRPGKCQTCQRDVR